MNDAQKQMTGKIVMAEIFSFIAVALLVGSTLFSNVSRSVAGGEITAMAALDKAMVPARMYVTVRGEIVTSTIFDVYSNGPSGMYNRIFALKDSNNLLIFCPYNKPCAEELAALQDGSKIPSLVSFQGRIYNYNDYAGPLNSELPNVALTQVTARLNVDEAQVRVLSLGESPSDATLSSRVALVIGIIVGLFAVFLWIMTFRKTPPRLT